MGKMTVIDFTAFAPAKKEDEPAWKRLARAHRERTNSAPLVSHAYSMPLRPARWPTLGEVVFGHAANLAFALWQINRLDKKIEESRKRELANRRTAYDVLAALRPAARAKK